MHIDEMRMDMSAEINAIRSEHDECLEAQRSEHSSVVHQLQEDIRIASLEAEESTASLARHVNLSLDQQRFADACIAQYQEELLSAERRKLDEKDACDEALQSLYLLRSEMAAERSQWTSSLEAA